MWSRDTDLQGWFGSLKCSAINPYENLFFSSYCFHLPGLFLQLLNEKPGNKLLLNTLNKDKRGIK